MLNTVVARLWPGQVIFIQEPLRGDRIGTFELSSLIATLLDLSLIFMLTIRRDDILLVDLLIIAVINVQIFVWWPLSLDSWFKFTDTKFLLRLEFSLLTPFQTGSILLESLNRQTFLSCRCTSGKARIQTRSAHSDVNPTKVWRLILSNWRFCVVVWVCSITGSE